MKAFVRRADTDDLVERLKQAARGPVAKSPKALLAEAYHVIGEMRRAKSFWMSSGDPDQIEADGRRLKELEDAVAALKKSIANL